MPDYFLGVDIGNTKSHALIATAQGETVGFAAGSPGNHEVLGVDGFRQALHRITDAVLTSARIEHAQLRGAGFGIAGYDWPSDLPLMRREIDGLGLDAPYEVVNDSLIGLFAGARRGWGVVVSAGTSSNCRGLNPQGREGRITGNGATFGEYGGGVELVYRALDAISRAWSLRGPQTALAQVFVHHTGAADVSDLLEGIARGRYRVQATDAPLVFQAASQGDAVAQELILWISRELGNLAVGVIRQLEIEQAEFEVVMAGSFYKGSPLIAPTMRPVIHAVAPHAELVRLEAPPVVGAALLGMQAAGLDFTRVRQALIKTTHTYLAQASSINP
jgi:N-acetylglucosamine kinase-like BadF-type ATPase